MSDKELEKMLMMTVIWLSPTKNPLHSQNIWGKKRENFISLRQKNFECEGTAHVLFPSAVIACTNT